MISRDFIDWLSGEQGFAADSENSWKRALERFFAARRIADAEDCAQQTMVQALRIFIRGEHKSYPNPARLMFGIAKNVFLEQQRAESMDRKARPVLLESVIRQEEQERRLRAETGWELTEKRCLESCCQKLSGPERVVADRYWAGIGDEVGANKRIRRTLADELAIDEGALKTRANRVLKQLRACMENCLAQRADRQSVTKTESSEISG